MLGKRAYIVVTYYLLVTGPTLGNNVALIGGVVGAALAVLFAAIVVLLVTLCACHRYHISKKRINQ